MHIHHIRDATVYAGLGSSYACVLQIMDCVLEETCQAMCWRKTCRCHQLQEHFLFPDEYKMFTESTVGVKSLPFLGNHWSTDE